MKKTIDKLIFKKWNYIAMNELKNLKMLKQNEQKNVKEY